MAHERGVKQRPARCSALHTGLTSPEGPRRWEQHSPKERMAPCRDFSSG